MKFTSTIILASAALVSAHAHGTGTAETTAAPSTTVTFIYPISNTTTTFPHTTSSFVTLTSSTTVVIPPFTTSPSVGPIVTGTGGPVGTGTGAPGCRGNCTVPTGGTPSDSSTATNTPKSPSATPSAPFTGAASANQAGLILASMGLLVAYFL